MYVRNIRLLDVIYSYIIITHSIYSYVHTSSILCNAHVVTSYYIYCIRVYAILLN